jgi:HEPN domain-containing protein
MATRIDLAKRLLQRAGDDEAAAKAMLPIESVTDVIVGMLAQQAVEKSLKAVLSFSAVNFPFVHDIDELTVLCTNTGHLLPDSLRGADQLTPYAGTLRYDADDPELVDRETALCWATSAVAWARGIVEATVEPVAPEDEAVD